MRTSDGACDTAYGRRALGACSPRRRAPGSCAAHAAWTSTHRIARAVPLELLPLDSLCSIASRTASCVIISWRRLIPLCRCLAQFFRLRCAAVSLAGTVSSLCRATFLSEPDISPTQPLYVTLLCHSRRVPALVLAPSVTRSLQAHTATPASRDSDAYGPTRGPQSTLKPLLDGIQAAHLLF